MFGWSPPNILATLVLCLSLLLLFDRSPTQAKPYRKQDTLNTYTTGNLGGFNERDWPELVNYKNGHYIGRDKRSPTEVEDESPNSNEGKTLSVNPGKRQGIETPIEPLTSDSGLDKETFPHLNSEENVRSKVNQPQSETIGVPVEEEKKAVDDKATDTSTAQHQQESTDDAESNKLKSDESNEGQEKQHVSSSSENVNAIEIQGNSKVDSSSGTLNNDQSTESKTGAKVEESKAASSKRVDENAQVRSVQESDNGIKKLGNVLSDKNAVRFPGSSAPLDNSQANSQAAQTTITNNSNKQVNADEIKITTAKVDTPVTTTTSKDQNTAATAGNNAESSSATTQSSSQESAAIDTVPQMQNAPVGPVRDALGNSGSEIVTTRGASDLDSYAERDTEPKPSNGPEVGHFQVDDKSADLEINANSAGVKVKAKPASLQVVSRPGSHSPSAAAQERSFYHHHYHYPPYHPHHHWYPGLRRSYDHFHRRHFFHPYHSLLERRGFDNFYDEAPFYRRHMRYWYPHRHRHHFHDSDLYERSRMEEPDDYPKYRGRRRHKRRFRHMTGPYKRQFYNNIPIMNGMESPQMGMTPEEGTMPQLPIGGGIPFTQRQNIITPVPPPINVVGNPPPGLLGGINGANFAMNQMTGLNNFNGASQMNNLNAFDGLGGINGMNNMGAMGLNSLEPMGGMERLPGEINNGMEGMGNGGAITGATRALGTRNANSPSEAPRMAFKKTAILSNTKNKNATKEHSHDQKMNPKKNASNVNLKKDHSAESKTKGKVNLKSWEKTLKRYHRLNVFTSKAHERHQYRRNAKSSGKSGTKTTGEKMKRKHGVSHLHAQHAKDVKGNRKNAIVMHRPPIIYHPPPEIYHRPDIVVHRAPIMLHRPPIIYHQPPVVVHRPAIIYHQPPIVFHQPPPVVHQPILHSHDTWVTKPMVYHTASMVSHAKTYYGIPSHVYSGDYGEGCHGAHCSYRKEKVPHGNFTQTKNVTQPADHKKKTKRDSFGDYMAYFTSLWKPSGLTKREINDEWDFITSTDGTKEKLTFRHMNGGEVNKRDTITESKILNSKFKRETGKEEPADSKDGTQKKKKKDVVVNRPPIIYHPPPEIYHRPDIVVHRPPLVIHRPPIIYHQPPVIVHRPAVVYHQPPIVFHQPPPAVSQPLLYSHDSFTVHPSFYATHHGSVVRDFGHYVGVPNVITNYGNPLFGRGPPMGKRSEIETAPSTGNKTTTNSDNSKSKQASLGSQSKKAKNETSEKAGKKNTVVVSRPPIIYHPPPEIYHRPIIVVHRPPIMIHRAPIFYHQPPVVVHRPAIVYHQPPLIFHQPPPMVHQPVLKSHDTWISHPVVVPYSSRVMHHHTYVGVPDAYTVHHFGGHGNSFYKSHILKQAKSVVEKPSERNKISGEKNTTKSDNDATMHETKENIASKLKHKKAGSQKGGKKNAVIVRRPPVIYHPPPEIYHRPEIVVHRAPIVIHRAPIIYHQPPVIVHRPAVVYHQPALIFHQPPPLVRQPVFRSHDTYVHRPVIRLYGSRLHHAGHFYHIPHAYFHGHGGVHYMAYGKSKVPLKENVEEEKGDTRATVKNKKKGKSSKAANHIRRKRKHIALTRSKDKTETGTKLHKNHDLPLKRNITYHKAKEVTEKANKKNSVVIHRPPIIYHPPPEIYHRPDIVVHRAPIVLYRAPIIYHQPPVVVHRPAIVYHQPPIVFHQPPPMVHQPVLHSHDTWVTKPVVIPYASHVRHVATYKGVPHEEIFMHGIGTGAFGKSHVPVRGTRRNKIDSVEGKNQTGDEETKEETEMKKPDDQAKISETQGADDPKQPRARIVKLGARERIARALSDFLVEENRKPVGAGTRIQRSVTNLLPLLGDQVASTYSSEFPVNPQGYDDIPEQAVGAAARIQRSIDGSYIKSQTDADTTPVGARTRIERALADPRTSFEGEKQYEMYKRSNEETENTSTPDENADKNTNSTKKTLLIIRRPPILYHPPSHMIHRPSIVVHRPDIIVHRHPIIFHRPPILVHRPPIIIHRQPVLIHRPPIIVHRPPLVFHRPPIIIHRRPYIIHHHPILFHRPPIIIHKGPQIIVHHSHLIHHYPMHMIHMHCPGCGFGKSTVARLEDNTTEHDNKKTSHSDSTVKDAKGKSSNKPKRSVADKKSKKDATDANHKGKRKDGHKKKKDVVVNRPPIIYHPPPEVYHRPDIVVHRAPILIHRPPIVYHQPPVVVHRPAVVYHQPPIVFHQPAPAVNQPLLFSHDSFVVHPMAFASHMGSVVNDAGHYVGLPHGGVTNFPGSIPHGLTGHVFPAVNSPSWARRTEVVKPQSEKHAKFTSEKHKSHQKRLTEKDDKNGSGVKKNVKPTEQKSKHIKGERKNKVIVARPPMIYHPPPEIYDRPDIVVHRPDIVIHRPSIVYHQPSVVVHRAPVVYQQPPVVFHQPAPMVSQPVYHAHDTYVAHPVFRPHVSHIAHSETYVGAPHFYPGHNSYGWGLSEHAPTAPTSQYGYTTNYGYYGYQGYTPTPTYGYSSYGPAFGRSDVEKGRHKTSKKKDKDVHNKDSTLKKGKSMRKRRSAELSKRHLHHRHHHHHHHHRHAHHHRGSKRFYHLRPISSFAHRGHRKHVVIIHRPPLIYHPPPQVYRQPDILMHLPPLVYHRPAVMFQQPPTIVHHPSIIYHQPPVVFHNPQPIIHSPIIQSHDIITPHLQHVMVPTSSYVHPTGNYFGPVVAGQAYGKSHIERTDAWKDSPKSKSATNSEKDEGQKANVHEKREASSTPEPKTDHKGSKKQNVDLVVHQPPIVYHPPPDIFDKPAVVMHPPPMIVHRPPILIHRAPVVVHRPPVIIHRPPIVLHHPTPVYHVAHGHFFHPYGRSIIENESPKTSRNDKHSGRKHKDKNSTNSFSKQNSSTKKGERKNLVVVHRPPMVYHPPPEIYDRPDVIVHRPDIVVHRPSVVYHQPSVVVHRPPIIYQQPPVVFHQPPPMVQQPVMHAHDTYLAHPVPVPYTSHVQHAGTYVGAPHFYHQPQFGGYVGHAYGKSDVEKVKGKTISNKDASRIDKATHKGGKTYTRSTRATASEKKTNESFSETTASREKSSTKIGERKNLVVVHRPPLIYHPPPEIYDKPDVIVHRPDIVMHRPSVVYHQPSVVVHRPPIIYQQPPVVFHQPPPMVQQPVLHAHDTYLAHPVPVPYTSHVQHAATYVGAPHLFHQPLFSGYAGHAFGKSNVEKVKSKAVSVEDGKSKKKTRNGDKMNVRATRDTGSEKKTNKHSSETSKGHKKNKVIIARPPMIYHPPPEIYDRPDIIVHRPDIVIHRPSVVYHQPSVVVHRPPIIYRQPPVVFHQPSPLVHQPIMHAHDTYVAHPVPVPYSSHIQHTSTYVGSPHHFPGGWNYGWSQFHSFAPAYGKSKVPRKHSKSSKDDNLKSKYKNKVRRATKDNQEKNDKEAKPKSTEKSKKKNQVFIQRPPLIYHPPAEVYHKPDIIMHRPDIVIHRPSVVYHQPSVVVHRPPVIYQQPPVVFHQPSPMVTQPVLHSHDTYFAHPYFTPYSSNVYHGGHYMGAPNFFNNGWGWGGHGYGLGHALSKSKVEKSHKKHKIHVNKEKDELKGSRRTLEKEEKEVEDAMRLKNETKATRKGSKKNLVIMHRPPLIYHPPPEVYHKPDIILHRPDIVVHRPSIVFHQPSVVVHRPPVIYHQPPVVFHQPSPMVHQPILHSHDTYLAHPQFVPFLSHLHHTESYVGAPNFYPGGWGWGHHGYGAGFHHAFGKSKVEKESKHQRENNNEKGKESNGKRRTIKNTQGKSEKKKDEHKGHKKNLVVMHRPPLVYHPPPEIYHKPDIIVHRPDLVIHRPSIVFHQPSVVVHRPPVIYRQPPVVFHQPSPMVHQPIFHSHETYLAHPHFVPYLSHLAHAGSYVGAPHFFPGHWGPTHGFGHFMGHAFDKSKVEKGSKKENIKQEKNESPRKLSEDAPHNKTKRDTTEPKAYEKTKILKHIFSGAKKRENHKVIGQKTEIKAATLHPQKEDKKHHKKDHKKNMVIIQRPNLIYHPPPEIYDRPSIIVHRPDFVIHQPSIVYHQPSVVVHRPPIVYNPPPVVFHQPAPMVHQPLLTAHDMYHSHPHFVPYASHISHAHTYVGAPHYYAGGWRYGNGFSDPALAQRSGWNMWDGYRTPWFPSSSYRANNVAPTRVAPSSSYRANYITPTPVASRSPYSLAFSKSHVQKHDEKPEDSSKTRQLHDKPKHTTRTHGPVRKGERNTRSAESKESVKSRLHKKAHHNGEGDKKNLVIMRRPPLVYHPPPEIYHKPDVVVHRPDIVIHRPSVVYHQPSVVVHRPPVVYKQPPVVFHQPAPMVNQPIFHAHESYMAHPAFVPYTSHIQHSGTYVGSPEFYHGGWNYGYGHAYGKSHVLKHKSKSKQQHKKSEKKTKIEGTRNTLHPQEEKDEKASRKNDIVVSRPPIIYHPPPEIYHRPDIVVHRAPIVLHRPPIIYHQPPVVVHRPAVVYHQPPVVFHQPPPTINQPILHSHDSFVLRPAARFFPQGSTVTHSTSYVGIPNHVIHGDELDFHHFHRSQIEHSSESRSSQKPPRAHIAKSTISKMPTTNKENTETTITDQTQKKTLRSTIHHHRLSKRQLMGSHSLYGPVSPINNIHDLYKSIEHREKLSTIPGWSSDRQNEVAKRADESGYDITKRQIIVPESTENVFHNILPPVYNALQAPAFQDQTVADTEELPRTDGTSIEHLPGLASSLHDIQELGGAGIARSSFPLSLQQYLPTTQKEDSPDVRIHVETTKSSIPPKKREKRQMFPILQQQGPAPVPRVLIQPQSLGGLGVIHAAAPPSVYNLFSQYHPAYHTITDPLRYLQMATQLQHRPRVNINVQSARSTIPDMEHLVEKRSKESKSKRQLLAVVPPLAAREIPLGGLRGLEAPAIMRNFPPYSPYSPLSRFILPPLPHLSYPDESEPEENTFLDALHPAQHIHNVYSTLPEEESNEAPIFNPWASYLSALYNSFLESSLYHSHHKPKVHVEVQASKSHIPKVIKTVKKQDVPVHARISKRQLYNYLPDSTLTSHYALPTAVNYGIPGFPFHQNSPHININVDTAKKNGIPSVSRKRRSPKVSSTKHREESKIGDKRDELVEGGESDQEITPNSQGITPNGGNSNFANAPENQFVATSEAAPSVDRTTSNDNEQVQGQEEASQQQPYQEMVEQRQELQENSNQQSSPSQLQPVMVPFQAQQQLAFGGNSAPVQVPLQQSMQSEFQAPFQAPFMVPFQGILPNEMPGPSSIPVSEQSNPQQVTQIEEEQPKHTSINVNVAAKSTVPEKKAEKSKSKVHKRQFITSTQGLSPAYGIPIVLNGAAPVASGKKPRVSINVQTSKKSSVENGNNKRQSISLLTRFPAMQVLPQTFKQNGILMPAFNTLPINHKIKSNGMLLEELQRQRKHKIPQTAKTKKGSKIETGPRGESRKTSNIQWKQKENARKRQFYAVPQLPLAVQQFPVVPQLKAHTRPHVSVNVDVNKRKSEFPRGKHHGQLKRVKGTYRRFDDKSKSKRQVYGMDQLPHMIHLPDASTPLLSQTPLKTQRPRVSVHVEVAKKKNKLLSRKDLKKEPPKKGRRQIYGLSELPHEGLPLQVASQDQSLAYLPGIAHTPHISINVEASKRSDEAGLVGAIHKRQVFGLQPPLPQPFEQAQEPAATFNDQEALQSNDQALQSNEQALQPNEQALQSNEQALQPNEQVMQSNEQVQGGLAQSPIHLQEESQQDQSAFTAVNSNPTVVQQQQQAEGLSSNGMPSQAGLSETDYQRPKVSVHVEASKRSKDRRKESTIKNIELKRKENAEKRQLQQNEQEPEDYEPDVNDEETVANAADPLQDQRPRVSVKVDVAKKKHHVATIKKIRNPVKRQFTVPFNGGLNSLQGTPIQNTQFITEKNQEDNGQGIQQVAMLPQSQSEIPEQQQQQQQVMQPVTFVQPLQQQQQQIQPFQQVMLPLAHTVGEKTRPKVSISVQTAKSMISTNNDHVKGLGHHSKQTPKEKSRRQLFGTVPLLSSIGQPAVSGGTLKESGRSTVPQSAKVYSTVEPHIHDDRKDRRSWKRQLYNYLGGQQEQQILPTQSIQSIAEPQQQDATAQPVEVLGQDAGVQLTPVNLPQASLLQTNDQPASQPFLTQAAVPVLPENNQQASVSPIQSQESSVSPLGTFQRPRVSINVQTAKSHVPNLRGTFQSQKSKSKSSPSQLTSGKDRETKKFKRQFDLLGGGVIERRRGPKFVAGSLKKPREGNLFNLGNNLNKPVEVFADPISNLVAGGAAGRKRPKLGGIRLDSPTGVGALPLKGAANPLEGALPPDLGTPTILQDSPVQAAPPLAQEVGVSNEPLFRPPSGIAGPQLESLEREGPPNVPLSDLPPTGPAVFPLPAVNRAFLPNFPAPAAPLPQANPLFLAPRIFPILPLAPPMAVPPVEEPPTLQETAPELPQAPPQLAPLLPPVIPMPIPNTAPPSAIPTPQSIFAEPQEDKPSVHVNVETSRSNVPEREHHSKQHANGPANRG